MARRIELRTGVMIANGNAVPMSFDWGEMITTLLRHAPQGQGLVLDQVLRSVDALAPVSKARAEKAETVTLSEEQWRTLKERLEGFPFPIADPAIAEFGLAIRNAPEIT